MRSAYGIWSRTAQIRSSQRLCSAALPAELEPALVQLLRLQQQLLVARAEAPGRALQRGKVRCEQQVVRLGVGLDA